MSADILRHLVCCMGWIDDRPQVQSRIPSKELVGTQKSKSSNLSSSLIPWMPQSPNLQEHHHTVDKQGLADLSWALSKLNCG
jgi:hypothetical protein